ATTGHDQMQIRAQGNVVGSVTTAAGQFTVTSFTASVTSGGHLDVELSDLGGSNNDWVINSLEARPAGDVQGAINFNSVGSLEANGVSVDTFTGHGATASSLVT